MRDRGHGGRLRRTSDTFWETEDPAGVSGHLRGLGRILEYAVGRCPRNRDFKVVPASLDASREWQRGYGEALSLLSPEPPRFARRLDRRLLDRGDSALELVRIARADGDEAGCP